jgi:sulfite exporter TauE/SafE/copper chaperone CopZ
MRGEHLRIGGMTCANCERRIQNALLAVRGVVTVDVRWADGSADVSYDGGLVSSAEIHAVIERLGYEILGENGFYRISGLLIIIAVLYVIISRLNLTSSLPLAESGTGYGMLFIIGVLTSVHCVAMCGGINLAQCIPRSGTFRASLQYNAGRVISYTLIGGIVGAVGSVITFSGAFKGIIQLIAGVFMVLMGANMLFPWFRKLQPRLPKKFALLISREKSKSNSPLIVGLLNGLMPCGPLQAMQLYALSTGSPLRGAVSMLLFSLGTVPLMFGLGALSSYLSAKFTRKIMTAGAVLVVVLGLTMFTRGAGLSGFSFGAAEESAQSGTIVGGVQLVNSTLKSGDYPKITVQAGIPVKWTIDAPKGSINGCNNRMQIPKYGIEYQFQTGENIIEFTPEESGRVAYSCWMGMIRSSIIVTEKENG